MKNLLYYISAILLLVLSSCRDSDDEPVRMEWDAENAPLSFKALAPEQTRTDFSTLDGTFYDIYLSAVYNSSSSSGSYYTGTYTSKDIVAFFKQMSYDEENSLFYLLRHCFPTKGTMRMYPYGVEKGHTINAIMFPSDLRESGYIPEYMELNLTKNYDGTFDIIVADEMKMTMSFSIGPENLPYAHFHHILSRVDFKVRWANNVSASSGIVPRLTINSIKMVGTSYNGIYRTPNNAAAGVWSDLGDDVIVVNQAADKHIPFGSAAEIGGSYFIPGQRNSFVVNYTIQNGDGANSVEKTMNYVVTDDVNEQWLPGYKYTYSITIGEQVSISIENVKVERFQDGNVGTTEIN